MISFEKESWLWYGIVMVMVICRFTSRVLHFKSFLRFQFEDYLMIYVTCAYTTFIVLINICMHTNTNLIDPKDVPYLTPQDIAERTYGSKVIVAVEQTMCMVQWGTKACLLFLYYRLTENLVQNLFVKIVGGYVLCTYIVMEVLYLGYWCRPFSGYWKTPTDDVQCTTALHHLIVNLSFNMSSDLLIMSIPLPLLLRTRLEIKRKIIICFPFCLGFFSIICAVISKYVSFTHPFSPVWSFWYTREASCIMIVANMPYTWGLLRRIFRLKSFWGRASNDMDDDSIEARQTHDTGSEILHGEIREIRGMESPPESQVVHEEKGAATTSTWQRISGIFESDRKASTSVPEILLDSRNLCEKSSPTSTRSDESGNEEPWRDVKWSKSDTAVGMGRVPTNQSGLSPTTLMPPSQPPTVFVPTNRRTSTAESRRASTLDSRRMSTFSSKRSARASVSEGVRRNTRSSINVDAIDRLYRLDDEDLIADLEAARPRSHGGGFD